MKLTGLDHNHFGIPTEIETLQYNCLYYFINFNQEKTSCLHMCVSDDEYLHNLVPDYFRIENFGLRPAKLVEPDDDKRAPQSLSLQLQRLMDVSKSVSCGNEIMFNCSTVTASPRED